MGYYTDFKLKITGPGADLDDLSDSSFLGETDYGHLLKVFSLGENGFYTAYEMKWYGYKDDMKEISERNPNLFFTLWGDGEENGDLWVAYLYRGQYEEFKAVIAYPKTSLKQQG